jgi:transcriptional regulator with XRE-family HTH domain
MDKRVNPEMLVLARESRGLNQGELAEKLNITQSLISKIEHGVSPATADILRKLSDVLHYPEAFFYQNDPVYGLVHCHAFKLG